MKNSPTPIYRRDYYLLNQCGQVYEKAVYHQGIFQTSFKRTDIRISAADFTLLTHTHSIVQKLHHAAQGRKEKWFMNNAPQSLIHSLAISYYLRYTNHSRKIPNIECGNWSQYESILSQYLQLLTIGTQMTKSPRQSIDALIRTTGKHFRNLRFGHIHLSLDYLENRPVWAIHWDTAAMDTLDIPATLTHWIHDDLIS